MNKISLKLFLKGNFKNYQKLNLLISFILDSLIEFLLLIVRCLNFQKIIIKSPLFLN